MHNQPVRGIHGKQTKCADSGGGLKGENSVSGFGFEAGVGYKSKGGLRFGADVHQFNLETKSDTSTSKSSEMIFCVDRG